MSGLTGNQAGGVGVVREPGIRPAAPLSEGHHAVVAGAGGKGESDEKDKKCKICFMYILLEKGQKIIRFL